MFGGRWLCCATLDFGNSGSELLVFGRSRLRNSDFRTSGPPVAESTLSSISSAETGAS